MHNMDDRKPEAPKGFKERVYEKLRMPLGLLDGIIAALVIAIAVALWLGTR